MNPIEVFGELFTMDSAFIRGWRWMFSARYRESVRAASSVRRPLLVMAAIMETLLVITAEVIAIIFLFRWLFRL